MILLISVMFLTIVFLGVKLRKTDQELNRLVSETPKVMAKAREDALKKSRVVIKGQISEQVAPFLKGFPYSATDLKFFGNGFDYICVVNMAEARDTDAIIDEIVFIDIKTGKAQLSTVQKKIRDAIVNGRVAWETMTINDDNSVSVKRATKKDPTPIDSNPTI